MSSTTTKRPRTITRLVLAGSFFLSGVVGAAIDVDGASVGAPADEKLLPPPPAVVVIPELAEGWSQCGGYEYSGPTECEEGFFCHENHKHYHQCWPRSEAVITPTVGWQEAFTRPPPAVPEPTTPALPLSTTKEYDEKEADAPLTTAPS